MNVLHAINSPLTNKVLFLPSRFPHTVSFEIIIPVAARGTIRERREKWFVRETSRQIEDTDQAKIQAAVIWKHNRFFSCST